MTLETTNGAHPAAADRQDARTRRIEREQQQRAYGNAGRRLARRLLRMFGTAGGWSTRAVLYRLHIYRRTHIVAARSVWLRTTVLGIRVGPDRFAHDID